MTRRQKLVVTGVALALLAAVPVGLAASGGDSPRSARPVHHRRVRQPAPLRPLAPTPLRPLTATVALGATGPPIPRSFLGLSMEYWGIPLFEARPVALARVLGLLHVPGDGPLMIRIGGDSADQSLWNPDTRRIPRWVFRLSRGWLEQTDDLLGRVRLRLILDLNLVTASPLRAAAWARAALAGLRPGSIAAFEVGNEPDLYDRGYWLSTIAHTGAVLPAAISPRSYLHTFDAYARALRSFAPTVPLMGPAVAKPEHSLGFIRVLALHARSELGALSAHRYPYSACALPGSAAFATVSRLLSPAAVTNVTGSVRRAVTVAHAAGLPLRLTELNSVTCGGRPGVSDTFATALWAPDALFALLRTGVDSVAVHVRARTINAAFVPVRTGVAARPLLYGLIAFVRTVAAGGHLVASPVRGAPGADVTAWAVRAPDGTLRLLLLAKGRRTVRVRLPAAIGGLAVVTRLWAASPWARGGMTLGGRWLDTGGRWRGRASIEHPGPVAGGSEVTLPGGTAALVTSRLSLPARATGHLRSR
ncbi:MAG TPA: hypothetical protein VLP43_06205 [Solirubrobacteraceae bacterium]|nr:hypothetical protein [Solirubrobacteraceae bacterium]